MKTNYNNSITGLVKRDTITELTDIGNSIGNSIKDMVGLETNKDIIDDIKDIDVVFMRVLVNLCDETLFAGREVLCDGFPMF